VNSNKPKRTTFTLLHESVIYAPHQGNTRSLCSQTVASRIYKSGGLRVAHHCSMRKPPFYQTRLKVSGTFLWGCLATMVSTLKQ